MLKQPPHRMKSTERMVDYDQNSSAQQSILAAHDTQLRKLAALTAGNDRELRIVDYGCGPGRSAIMSVRPVLEAWRAAQPDAPLIVCHADQPANDWNSLFGLVYGPIGYHEVVRSVRTEAAIGSFYDQVSGEASVDMATCFAASHWLSRAEPLLAPDTLWFADLEGEARRKLAKRANDDWTTFLRQRAKELRPGGYLLISTLGSVPDRSERNGVAASGRAAYRVVQEVAQSMAADDLLDRQILDQFVFALWFMTADEARAPIEENSDLASAYDIETVEVVPAPHNPTDCYADLLPDPEAYTAAYVGYIRGYADSSLRTQLFGPAATKAHSEDWLADEFYRRLTDLYRSRLSELACEIWHLTVVLRKK